MPYEDPEKRRRYKSEYYQRNRTKILEQAAQYRAEHADAISETKKRIYHERYKVDPQFKAQQSAYQKKRRRENTTHVKAIEKRCRERNAAKLREYGGRQAGTPKRLARQAVTYAVRVGKLPKVSTLFCVTCKQPANEYHHHKGYARANRLDVEPICHQCHKDSHHSTSIST